MGTGRRVPRAAAVVLLAPGRLWAQAAVQPVLVSVPEVPNEASTHLYLTNLQKYRASFCKGEEKKGFPVLRAITAVQDNADPALASCFLLSKLPSSIKDYPMSLSPVHNWLLVIGNTETSQMDLQKDTEQPLLFDTPWDLLTRVSRSPPSLGTTLLLLADLLQKARAPSSLCL